MSEAEGKKKGMPAWAWVLIGCGGLVVLVVIVVVVLGIIGVSKARSIANQVNTVGTMKAYCSAQTMYHRNDWDSNGTLEYATPYPKLYSTKDSQGNQIMLIDAAFAAAQGSTGTPKLGYVFQDMQTIGGKKIDWVTEYGLCGLPGPGSTSTRMFMVGVDGVVLGKERSPGAGFVTDYPPDPIAAGWIADF